MKSGRFILLLAAAVIICVGAIIAYQQKNARTRDTADNGLSSGSPLVSGLSEKAGDIRLVEISKGTEKIVLTCGDENDWKLESRNGYPADAKKINQLVFELTGIRVADRLTDKPEKYKDFGLEGETGSEETIRLADKSGNDIARVRIGDERSGTGQGGMPMGGGRYFRVGNDPHVYLADASLYWANTRVSSWAHSEIVSISSNEIVSVEVDHSSTESFTTRWEGTTPVLDHVPEDKQLKTYEFSSIRGALGNLRLDDVLAADSDAATSLTFGTTCKLQAKDGSLYTVKSAKADTKHYIGLSASYTEPVFSPEDKATTTSLAAAEEKAKKAEEAIVGFNEKHQPWLYEISSWSYDRFTKRRSDLLEPKPKPKPKPKPESDEGAKDKPAS